ncbi:MAG: phage holin [Clostridia bacterium]|nr:phage holin [Clostridia bacterium]
MKISAGTLARTACLFLALVNQLLIMAGKEILPFEENQVYETISAIFTTICGLVAWWKNNSYTTAAIKADVEMKKFRQEGKKCE